MSRIEIEVLHPTFVVEVRGVDLARPLDDETFARIRDILNANPVTVFPEQTLDAQSQVAFSARFGPLEKAVTHLGPEGAALRVANISNLDANGKVIPPTERQMLNHAANRLWHVDSSWKPEPASFSMLCAKVVPPSGGETEFADIRDAWEKLPEDRKQRLRGLRARHDYNRSRSLVGENVLTEAVKKRFPPTVRPLVVEHPHTGRSALYVASHCVEVEGWDEPESRALFDELLAWATTPERVYTHHWRVGDLVVWDNRAAMHRGRGWDDAHQARVMHRTTVSDTEVDWG